MGWFNWLTAQGRKPSADIPMFFVEAIIAPPVVLVIFFLFEFSGITAVTPNATSIGGSIGLAFLLGFAIRRTLGLLDTIKRKILPAPAPAPTPPASNSQK